MPLGGSVISHWHALIDNFNTSAMAFYQAVEEAVKGRQVPDAAFSRVEFKEGGLASAKREYLRIERRKVAFDLCGAPFGSGFFFSWWLVRPGPRYPFLWFFAFVVVVMLWACIVLWAMLQAIAASSFGRGGGAGCLFLVLLVSLPVGLALLGWAIREGYTQIADEDVLAIPLIGWLYERLFNPLSYYRLDTALMFQESVRRAVNEVIDGLLTGQGLRALSEDQQRPTIRDLA